MSMFIDGTFPHVQAANSIGTSSEMLAFYVSADYKPDGPSHSVHVSRKEF